jgi:RNA 3'-terminal phosphate cyclase-like protein
MRQVNDRLVTFSRRLLNSFILGTSLFYAPGLLIGGTVEHECECSRGISYYLEPLIYFAPFMKQPLEITLKGVTNDPNDISVRKRFFLKTSFF